MRAREDGMEKNAIIKEAKEERGRDLKRRSCVPLLPRLFRCLHRIEPEGGRERQGGREEI